MFGEQNQVAATSHAAIGKPLIECRDGQEPRALRRLLHDCRFVANQHQCVGLIQLGHVGVCGHLARLGDLPIKIFLRFALLADVLADRKALVEHDGGYYFVGTLRSRQRDEDRHHTLGPAAVVVFWVVDPFYEIENAL